MHRHASVNRAYRLVFHRVSGTCSVAPETARSGKAGGVAARAPTGLLHARRQWLASAMVFGLGLCWALAAAAEPGPPAAGALPTGGQVTAGSASLSTSGSTLTVGQASQRAILHWSSFDVGSAAAVNFVQPNAAAVTLNRVTGGGASQIFGRVSANGQVYLVNPSGVLFGPSAQVDAGGLVASTLGISDADFLAGRDRFTQGAGEGASVVNQGRISVSPGGRIALLGTRVSNQGQLLTPGGDVALAAGRQVTLAAGADGHLQIGVDASELATVVSNGGLVQADGGSITLNAQGANALASAVVSNTGTLQARTVDSRDGRILLLADQGQGGRVEVGGTLDGMGHVVNGLTINRTDQAFVGLFSMTGNASMVGNIGLSGMSVSGESYVGGLVGRWFGSTINNSYAVGNVSGNVSSPASVGGLLGIQSGGSLSNAYATGSVSGTLKVGGLIGWVMQGSVSSAYWNIRTTGQLGSAGGGSGASCTNYCGLDSAEMMMASSFANWDLATQGGSSSVWRIYEGHTAPLLRSFLTPLTVTATTSGNKIYDGTVDIAGALYAASGPPTVDTSLILGQARTASKNVGTYSVDLSSLYSTQQGYDIRVAPSAATYTVTPKPVTGSITAADKVYDGVATAATSGALAGVIAGDSVTLSSTGSFVDRHVGIDKTVNVGGNLAGADAGNYTLDANATAIASILPKPLTGSITAADKVYDGTRAATTSGAFIGAITGDDVVLSSSGSFADRNVGAGKTVTVSGSLAGADAGNYTLDVNATTTAGITRKGLDGRIIAADKVYDGTTAATTSGALDGAIAGDDVNFSTSGSFADRHAGTGKTVTVGGNLAGSDAGNYFLQSSNADTTATITPRTLTGRITAADKVYDGTSAAVISGTLAGVIAGDDVTFSSSGSFADKSVGTGKTVNVSGSLAGADVGNYVLDPNATTTASIAPKPLTGRITAADKVYDGTTMAATSGSLAGAIAGDSVDLISKGSFADSSAGTGKTVSVSARLSGADAGNYILDANGTAIASITPASLVVTANDAIQPWTGRPFAGGHGVRYIGFVPGEDASVLGGALAYGGNAQGASLPGRYGLTVSGLASGNYDIQYHGGSLSIVAPEATPPAGELQRQTAPTAPVLGDISGALASRRSGVPLSIAADYIKVD